MTTEKWKRIQKALIFVGVFALFLLVVIFFLSGKKPRFPVIEQVPPEISALPLQLLYSFLRMCAAYVFSLVLGIAIGTWAATNARAGSVLLPLLDILQAVPVLGFFPVAIAVFVENLGGGRFALEVASIFLILTSQAWNIAYGVYEGIATLPSDAKEAMAAYGVTGWHRFWRLYMPACVPKLVYNSMLSWANGWYFLIACEILALGPVRTTLPGIGSFLLLSSQSGEIGLTFVGLGMLLALIIAMEFFIWSPLARWSEKYCYEFSAPLSWTGGSKVFEKWRQIHLRSRLKFASLWLEKKFLDPVLRMGEPLARFKPPSSWKTPFLLFLGKFASLTGIAALLFCLFLALQSGYETLSQPWPPEASEIPLAIASSFVRLIVALIFSVAIAFPIAVWAGNDKRVLKFLTPIAEIGASVPATALFPIIVLFVIHNLGGMNVASILLLMTGMIWYVLFNLLAGVRSIPEELQEATRSMGIFGWMRWKRLMIPALFPSLITGSITAFGGGWNALIVSEYGVFQGKTYEVQGIGAILQKATFVKPDSVMVLLSVLALVSTVVIINRIFWRPLYELAAEQYKIEG